MPRPPPRGRRPRASRRAAARRRPAPRRTRARRRCRGTSSRVASGKVRTPSAVSTSTPRGRASSAGVPSRDDPAADEDRDAVAHQLDLAEQVRARAHGDAARRGARGAGRGRPAGRPGRGRWWARPASAGAASPPAPARCPSRCCMPLDMAATFVRARVREAHQLEQLAALVRAPLRPREVLVEREQLVGASASRGSGTARRDSRSPRAPRPSRPARPPPRRGRRVARTRPQAIFVSVDLPAPFGPSRPSSSPGATSRSTPPSATVAP